MTDDKVKLVVKLAEMRDAPIPKCKNCGHEICIHCGNWCDTIACNKEQVIEFNVHCEEDINDEKNYPILCCDGGCEV